MTCISSIRRMAGCCWNMQKSNWFLIACPPYSGRGLRQRKQGWNVWLGALQEQNLPCKHTGVCQTPALMDSAGVVVSEVGAHCCNMLLLPSESQVPQGHSQNDSGSPGCCAGDQWSKVTAECKGCRAHQTLDIGVNTLSCTPGLQW